MTYYSGELAISADLELDTLVLFNGANVNFSNEKSIQIHSFFNGELFTDKTTISAETVGSIEYDKHELVCFDNLAVTNVNFTGQASVNVGLSGEIVNSDGWFQEQCEKVLFANFDAAYTCVNGVSYFTSTSSGEITSYKWDFGDGKVSNNSDGFNVYEAVGDYEVLLEITNEQGTSFYSQLISVGENDISAVTIAESGENLVSVLKGDTYQWFFNGERIEGGTERILSPNNGAGSYQVAVFLGECNLMSEPFEFIVLKELNTPEIVTYPNPFSEKINLQFSTHRLVQSISVLNLEGKEVLSTTHGINGQRLKNVNIDASNLPKGIYFLLIELEGNVTLKQLIKN